MQQIFSPKQVAKAIGASESSVKRWCDRGILPSLKTAGGHRRLPLSGVLEFIRDKNRSLLCPEELGLPGATCRHTVDLDRSRRDFAESVTIGNFAACRRIVVDLFLARVSLARIFDDVIVATMRDLGESWCTGDVQVFQERRGCEMTFRLIHDLRAILPLPAAAAPRAMGASVADDPYCLPTRMVEITLVECGWRADSLGCGIPFDSLAEAVRQYHPRLFWISASVVADEDEFLTGYAELSQACQPDTALVVGGRGLTQSLRRQMQHAAFCDNLQCLASFARDIYRPNSEALISVS